MPVMMELAGIRNKIYKADAAHYVLERIMKFNCHVITCVDTEKKKDFLHTNSALRL